MNLPCKHIHLSAKVPRHRRKHVAQTNSSRLCGPTLVVTLSDPVVTCGSFLADDHPYLYAHARQEVITYAN